MKKLLIKLLSRWLKPEPSPVSDASSAGITSLHIEIQDLEARLAHSESELQKARAGNKALQDFIAARHKPDKILSEPPKIVKPFAVLVIAALTMCAQAQFLPPYVHNYWDTNANPIVMTVSNGIIVTNMTADVRGSQFFGFRLGTTAVPYPFMFETAATTDRLRGTNAVTHDWIDFNDGIDLGNLANTRVIMLRVSNGDVSATTFTGSGANLTALPALATVYPAAITNNDTRTVLVTGLSEIADTIFTTNMLAATNPTFWTNTTGRTVWAEVKGTGLTILLTTVSTFPNGPTNIQASTQGFLPARRNMVLGITNTTVTGNYLLSWPIN